MIDKFVIEIFYTNINLNNAGTEKYIKTQIEELNKSGVDVFVLFPVKKIVIGVLLDYWGIMLNGKKLQIMSMDEIVNELQLLSSKGKYLVGIIVQHLLNININQLQHLILSVYKCPIIVYLHDFYTACIQYNLLKNDLEFCGSAILNNQKCSSCRYEETSKIHKKKISNFFSKIENELLYFVAPSEFVFNLWKEAFPEYANKLHILEHLQMCGVYSGNRYSIKNNETLNIAYVGSVSKNKGWNDWHNAVNVLSSYNNNYHLYQIGNGPAASPCVDRVSVSVQIDGPDAMIRALRENNIHVAVLNSICPETYSFTFYECLASNAFIITNKNSGNIKNQVSIFMNGLVMDFPSDLCYVLKDEMFLRTIVNEYRKKVINLPEYFKNNRKYFKYLSFENKNWFVGLSRKSSTLSRIGCFITILLYNIRYYKNKQLATFNIEHFHIWNS